METLNRYRDFFLLTYFLWAAVIGVGCVGLLYWLTPLTAKLEKVITVGATLGIMGGGFLAFAVFFFNKEAFQQLMNGDRSEPLH